MHLRARTIERVVYISELGTEWTCVILDRRFQKYCSGLFWLVCTVKSINHNVHVA